ncbi:RNA-directed DNA polymerase, eukaryota, reverse transcriptase zinc-binding domain protein [Tanacetum coccineum]
MDISISKDDRTKQLKAFDDTKSGVKGLLDVAAVRVVDILQIFIRPPEKSLKILNLQEKLYDIYDNDGNRMEGNLMEQQFVNHFRKFLGANKVIKVTDTEIKNAIFDIGDSKAPGPDGYSSTFFKKAWKIVGKDVCLAIKEFFNTEKLLGEVNATLISLVPKISTPNKGAFIQGRVIQDNILITQELLKGYDRKSGHRERKGYFQSSRGLRQGDPMSPYLFTLVIKVFTLLMAKNVQQNPRFKYHDGCNELKLTHLCFVDDLLVVFNGDVEYVQIIKQSMMEFSEIFGLIPNMEKSTVFFSNVKESMKVGILDILPFAVGKLPLKYLEVLLITKRLTFKECKKLIDKVKARVGEWKNKYLSYASRLQLIASVLSSLNVRLKEGKQKWHGKLCSPKSQGGLGLRSFVLWNEVLLIKNLWNIIAGENTLWVKWMQNDETKWAYRNGNLHKFSSKIVWDTISIQNNEVNWHKVVWFSQCNPRMAFILWMAIRRKLHTQDRIMVWNNNNDMKYPLCSTVNDLHNYLFFESLYSNHYSGLIIISWSFPRYLLLCDSFDVLDWPWEGLGEDVAALALLIVVYVLPTPMPELLEDDTLEANVESAKELWDSLESMYMAEDASSKKFLVSNFNNYKMVNSRPIMEQLNELLRIHGQYTLHGLKMDESICVSSVIDKWPSSLRILNMRAERIKTTNKNKGKKRGLNDNNVGSGSNKKPKVACWKCDETGHFKNHSHSGNKKDNTSASGSGDGSKEHSQNQGQKLMLLRGGLIPVSQLKFVKIVAGSVVLEFSSGNSITLFNVLAIVRLSDLKRKTLDEKGIDCIFLRYAEHSKAYRLEDIMPNSDESQRDDHSNDVPSKHVVQLEYSKAIGCLMYALTSTRPDTAYEIGRLIRYPSVLEGYFDASWINHVKDSSSTSGWKLNSIWKAHSYRLEHMCLSSQGARLKGPPMRALSFAASRSLDLDYYMYSNGLTGNWDLLEINGILYRARIQVREVWSAYSFELIRFHHDKDVGVKGVAPPFRVKGQRLLLGPSGLNQVRSALPSSGSTTQRRLTTPTTHSHSGSTSQGIGEQVGVGLATNYIYDTVKDEGDGDFFDGIVGSEANSALTWFCNSTWCAFDEIAKGCLGQ